MDIRKIESPRIEEITETLSAHKGAMYASKTVAVAGILRSLQTCNEAFAINPVVAPQVLGVVTHLIDVVLPSLVGVAESDVVTALRAMNGDTKDAIDQIVRDGE